MKKTFIHNTKSTLLTTKIYKFIEMIFHRLTRVTIAILSNSITFIIALGIVFYFLTNKHFFELDWQKRIEEIIIGFTFLTVFIIQKEFKHFRASLNIKLNELVVANDLASNKIMNLDEKTEEELQELSDEYFELASISIKENQAIDNIIIITH